MPTTVYRNMTGKNADQGTYMPMRSSLGMKNSIHVNPGSLVLSTPAGDQIGCFSRSTDIYMRNVNPNTIDTEKTNCSTKQPFYRESQLDGGRASTFAQYANAQVNHPRPIYGASTKPMMKEYFSSLDESAVFRGGNSNYGGYRDSFTPKKSPVIMGRMQTEYFTNRCGMR